MQHVGAYTALQFLRYEALSVRDMSCPSVPAPFHRGVPRVQSPNARSGAHGAHTVVGLIDRSLNVLRTRVVRLLSIRACLFFPRVFAGVVRRFYRGTRRSEAVPWPAFGPTPGCSSYFLTCAPSSRLRCGQMKMRGQTSVPLRLLSIVIAGL